MPNVPERYNYLVLQSSTMSTTLNIAVCPRMEREIKAKIKNNYGK